MNLSVTGHHIDITPALRAYVMNKMDRVLRHFDHVIDVNVVLRVEKLRQRAEVNVHLRGKDICVEGDEINMYAAIDSMVDKLDRQILRHKDRAYGHGHQSLKHQVAEI